MARKPTIRIGALARSFISCVKSISYNNVDPNTPLTQDLGALVRDTGSDSLARMVAELRRKGVDPLLDMNNLSGFVRPGKDKDE